MRNTLYTIHDTINGDTITTDLYSFKENLAPLFPEAPADVMAIIEDLTKELESNRCPSIGEMCTALGIRVSW